MLSLYLILFFCGWVYSLTFFQFDYSHLFNGFNNSPNANKSSSFLKFLECSLLSWFSGRVTAMRDARVGITLTDTNIDTVTAVTGDPEVIKCPEVGMEEKETEEVVVPLTPRLKDHLHPTHRYFALFSYFCIFVSAMA